VSTIDEIRSRALELSDSDRASLARDLLLSLEESGFDEGCEPAWVAEIEARSEVVARGEFTASDWQESVARIRHTLAQRPKS
jgi:putative addiction module component (TIGR02574 family)